MKLVFAGTPEFARNALAALAGSGHEIVRVICQPDRPAGRGLKLLPGAVKEWALAHRVPVIQPRGLRLDGKFAEEGRAAHALLANTSHDAMIVAAYGLILPQSVLDIAPCLNIHASLLPRWRGAAPIQRAIEAGDTETGITIMQMDAGLDTGPILLTRRIAITPDDTGGSLTAKLALLGGQTIVEALDAFSRGALVATPQTALGDTSAASYANKLSKTETALDFSRAARSLANRIRAFDPWPGCTAKLVSGEDAAATWKLWRANALPGGTPSVPPGTIVPAGDQALDRDAAIRVQTGDGILAITQLQKPGGKRLPAGAFAGELRPGLRFAAAPTP